MQDKIWILDGAMGTMIQRFGLGEEDYHDGPFLHCVKDLKGNSECLNLTRPDIIASIHKEYIDAGADIIETNTFSANRISQEEYGCDGFASEMALKGAQIARKTADEAMQAEPGRKIYVAGSMGPTSKSLSLAPDISNPAFRPYCFDEMYKAFHEQAAALIKGGADLILIETCFDALNTKAALMAVRDIDAEIPIMVSVSVSDRSGRTLTGQTIESFYTSVSSYNLLSFGLNCSLGAAELMPLVEDMDRWCRCGISCYPNAGLPNEMGEYDQSPSNMGKAVARMASKGLLNIAGGCCGTSPEHIRAIAEALKGMSPRHTVSENSKTLKVSGLETVTVDVEQSNFTNIGERTNVAGSRKFARLIASGEYETALQIAAKQIEDGADIIDINMDDAMLDSTVEMERFLRHLSNDPAVAKAAIMIDSSHWDTLIAGLKNAQGKCIVNSISLKEGEEALISKAKTINAFGAAMVVMAFDEEGQATSFERKIEISQRAYRLLTEKAGVNPHDIIFDVNILSIGTGIEEHSRYATDFIEAVRWIKCNLPGALTSGGVSNLSFAFRGNNSVREAMHSAFLYHAIKAGLDMAILNPSMLQVYDDIEPELLRCVEDVIFDTDAKATERLIEKASRMMKVKDSAVSAVPDAQIEVPLAARLRNALVKGQSTDLEKDLKEAIEVYGKAVDVIEGPLMEGMETVGRFFGEGRMFLPQVVKSAKVMKDAVDILSPYMSDSEESSSGKKPQVVLATVKGDVHDIGKNITGIVLTCNGFEVHDLGVMVDRDTILSEASRLKADMIAVSGLITPSLFQMEDICRAMAERGMNIPLFVGGATTSALHTAVKLAPLYEHVYHGPDASACAVMAKRYMMDKTAFEMEEHKKQDELRQMHKIKEVKENMTEFRIAQAGFPLETYPHNKPEDIICKELALEDILPYFDWKMFYAIWGVRYGSAVPEAAELMQLKRDAEVELECGKFRILITARFLEGFSRNDSIVHVDAEGKEIVFPMLRQESGKMLSLCDFVIPETSGRQSPFGAFAISINADEKQHVEGCCCPACSSRYEDLIGRTVKMTLAEAASSWLDRYIAGNNDGIKTIKPAAGYSSCPDHSLKKDLLDLIGEGLGIRLTESCAMIPEASICGMIFMHPDATYPEIRKIGARQYEDYCNKRGMTAENARVFLGHLLK